MKPARVRYTVFQDLLSTLNFIDEDDKYWYAEYGGRVERFDKVAAPYAVITRNGEMTKLPCIKPVIDAARAATYKLNSCRDIKSEF